MHDPPDVAAGSWLHNPVTGELARVDVSPGDTGGRRLEAQLWLQPGAAVAMAHRHATLVERFAVVEGSVAFVVDGQKGLVRAGDPPIEVAPGVVHDWWNAGDGHAHVRVVVEAAPGAEGRPATRFTDMIEAMWSLGALGRTDAKGRPTPLWLAVFAREYRDVIQVVRPPALVQALTLGPLAALARRTGRHVHAAELRGPGCAAAIPAPDDGRLRELLGRYTGALN